MHKLLNAVCNEIETLEKKIDKAGGIAAGDLEALTKFVELKKNLLKIEKMDEDDGMSNAMRGSYDGSYRGGQDGGSYRRSYDDGSYDGGSYARGRGRNAKRDSMGRYASERGYSRGDEFSERLRDMMDEAPDESTRHEIERLLARVEG